MNRKNRGRGLGEWVAGFSLIAGVGILVGLGPPSEGSGLAEPLRASTDPSTDNATQQAAFDYYRQNIEPLFLRPRGYPGSTSGNPACVMCHVWQTSVRFTLEEPIQTADGGAWTEEQSRRNYEVVTQLVDASDPESSRFLLKPLAQVAGGLRHTGGSFWDSTQDPEYQVILDWIRALPAAEFTPAEAEVAVDFQYYRSCVHPGVLSVGNYGQLACTSCHAGGQAGFAPRGRGGPLTEAQARQGFATLQRLIVPGDPERSRFLLKPLHPDGGGSYAHNGVRRWQNRSDPEWQTLAAWVRGEVTGTDCSPVY
ncbi:MAG: hypothetical protein IIC36_05895 [Gemmatimonadetes bacterium]|nr:hypothetical protein [Gemmatimonadota bacterium]